MKILASRFAAVNGGAERSYINHLRGFNSLEHEVVAFTNLEAAATTRASVYSSLWFKYKAPSAMKLFLILPQLYQILKIIYIEKPDVINPHSRFDQVAFTLLRPIHRRPVVWKNPGDIVYHLQNSRILSRKLYVYCIKKADAIYFLSEESKNEVLTELNDDSLTKKMQIIPSGIDIEAYDLKARSLDNAGKFVVGTISRLHEMKGVQFAIEALKSLESDIELWIVGEGEYEDSLRALVDKYSLYDRVKFMGERDNVSELYNSFAVFLSPSLQEAYGLTVNEARYFGKSIVASKTGGIPNQIEDGRNGILVEPGNSKEIAAAINKIYKDPELRSRLEKGARESALKDGDFTARIKNEIIPLFEKFL